MSNLLDYIQQIAKLKDQISTLTSQKAVAEHHISALNAEVELQATSIKNLEAKLRAETAVREAETKQIEEYREIQKKTAEKIKSFTVSLSNFFNAQVYKKMVVLSSRISFAIDRIAVMGELQRGNYTTPNAKHVTQNLNEQISMQENSLNRDTSADIEPARDESDLTQLLRHQISVMQEEREVFLRRIRSDEKRLAEYRREENTKLQSLENDLQSYIAELECRKNELENAQQRTHSLRQENQSLKKENQSLSKENQELKDGLKKLKDRGGIELTTQLKLEREKTSLLIDRLRERIAELEQEKKQLESNPIQSAGPSLATSSSVSSHSRTLKFDSSPQSHHSENIKNLVVPSSFYIDTGIANSHKIVMIDDTDREEYRDISNSIPNRSYINPQGEKIAEFEEQDTESEEDESQEAELEEQGTQERKKELRSDEKKKLLMLAEMTEQLLK